MTESQKFSRRDFLKGLGALIGGATLASCGVKPEETPHQLPTNEPTKIAPTLESTVPPTETAVPQQTATAEYRVGEGGAYTEVQQQVINSELTQLKKSQLENWMKYWYQFDNRPFDRESNQLVWKFVFDNPNTPTEAGVLIEAGGEYQGRMFYLPIKDGQYMTTPPEPSGNLTNIPEGFGPLEISAGTEGLFLSYQNNNWARVDSAGKVIETIDLQTGQWMKVEQEIGQIETEFEGIFSEKYYPNQYTESFTYIDQESGLEIPMHIGLDRGLPINAIGNTDLGKTFLGTEFLRACYYRYSKGTDNKISYQEYLELIKQGKGQVQIDFFDEKTNEHKQGLFDPRNGVSRTITGNEEMPLNMNPTNFTYDRHFYFTVNKSGQLIIVSELDKDLVDDLDEGEIKNQGKNPGYVYSYKIFSDLGTSIKYWAMLTPEHFKQGGVEDINSSKARTYDEFLIDLFMPIIVESDPWRDNQIPFMSVELSDQ